MNSKPLLLLLTLYISLQQLSCSTEDEGIYFDPPFQTLKTNYSTLELEVEDEINEYRNSINLFCVEKMNTISSVAQSHSIYMSENAIVNHDNFPVRNTYLKNYQRAKLVGENVAYGYGTAKGVLKAWLKSPKHKKIIENPAYTHMGISIENDIEANKNYFTLILITK